MKIVVNAVEVFLLGILLGCQPQSTPPVPAPKPTCDFSTDQVTSVEQATALLRGEWTLTQVATNLATNPPAPDQHLSFRSDNTCVVSRNGVSSGPLSYAVKAVTLTDRPTPYTFLRLVVAVSPVDSSKLAFTVPYGQPTLRLCSQQLMLDYGIAFDAPGYYYSRAIN